MTRTKKTAVTIIVELLLIVGTVWYFIQSDIFQAFLRGLLSTPQA